mmetsp:Transcript_13886/g.19286  ORF Transcript_13886/g.19286 Transcript_13886/m.19286 type:complete len:155 (-) Transcript_13886:811-1275(-)|eukprot:CAMPEP_0184481680 /NCGR_PEP_ID=MMETSP0113_2-20130426/3239_1 /TAXON_ID=91329 /ORGANISM="Norrisiella sphaerica, Strain BC52" /LENGTH=154 /DNA_ID=CAMNT_0026860953 /DNA_START=2623 /DNA_END=3087 /DNA_ORIENTATION=-
MERSRNRTKTELLHRKHQDKQKMAIDNSKPLHALAEDESRVLDEKTLQAKLATLLTLDTAARPSTMRNVLRGTEVHSPDAFAAKLKLFPIITKDWHGAKNKKMQPFVTHAFPFDKKTFVLSHLEALSRQDLTQGAKGEAVVEGKPTLQQETLLS